jgi:hypothetical protein
MQKTTYRRITKFVEYFYLRMTVTQVFVHQHLQKLNSDPVGQGL